jgi:RNA polymerase sigma-70 factor (ECF subfamily)
MIANNSSEISEARPTFNSLLETHGRELYALLWRMLGNPQDAEDCLQETYLRAFRAFERTTSDWNYRAWFYKITTNVARTYLKKNRRQDRFPEGENDQYQVDPLDAIAQKELVNRVVQEMARLSFRQRTAIMMRKYSDLDYDVIADALDCSPETARAHVYQGLKRLRERLGSAIVTEGNRHA